MPVKSYIAFPVDGQRSALIEALSALRACEVTPAENREVIIVVTDTPNPEAEQRLEERLQNIRHLKHLALVSGYDDPGP